MLAGQSSPSLLLPRTHFQVAVLDAGTLVGEGTGKKESRRTRYEFEDEELEQQLWGGKLCGRELLSNAPSSSELPN